MLLLSHYFVIIKHTKLAVSTAPAPVPEILFLEYHHIKWYLAVVAHHILRNVSREEIIH